MLADVCAHVSSLTLYEERYYTDCHWDLYCNLIVDVCCKVNVKDKKTVKTLC